MQIEQIYVVYTAINPETAPFYHKDLYYERSDGSVLYMRGAPGRNGNLSTSAQIFHPLSAELETVRSWELGREVITSGTDLSRTAQLLLLELRRINDAGITYVNDDTNSNQCHWRKNHHVIVHVADVINAFRNDLKSE